MAVPEALEAVDGMIPEEDRLRAQTYRLLASLLVRSPDRASLVQIAQLAGDESELGQALSALSRAAQETDPSDLADEYQDLFIGLGRGELVPFGSFYLTGFLHEKPLAKLRQDMARLGVARAKAVKEPEDHIGFVCETMAVLIEGDFTEPADLHTQRAFFETHLAPWAQRFFEDLEAAKSAVFYRPVGQLGRHFMTIEETAFKMI